MLRWRGNGIKIGLPARLDFFPTLTSEHVQCFLEVIRFPLPHIHMLVFCESRQPEFCRKEDAIPSCPLLLCFLHPFQTGAPGRSPVEEEEDVNVSGGAHCFLPGQHLKQKPQSASEIGLALNNEDGIWSQVVISRDIDPISAVRFLRPTAGKHFHARQPIPA